VRDTPNTLGHRKVLGILVPYFNSVVEPEFAALQPPGVTNQTAHFALDAQVVENAVAAATGLATCGVETFVVALSTESFPGGLEMLRRAAEQIGEATKRPVFTASHATHAALAEIGAKRIALLTPFDETANATVRESFETHGYSVVRAVGLGCAAFDVIARVERDVVLRAFAEANCDEAEALVQVGTGLPALGCVSEAERAAGKPVVTSNAAAYWQALRASGIDDRASGFGRLLAGH
jgi:maleate isomerase